MTSELRQTVSDASGTMSFGARLRQHAAERADHVAITILGAGDTTEHVRWAELNVMVDRIAQTLRERGVHEGHVVGIVLYNGLVHIAGVLACWRLGCTIMVFDPGLPQLQIAAMLDKANAVLAIVEDKLKTGDTRLFSRSDLLATMRAASTEPVVDRVSKPGKIMSSGGSTGTPKLMADDLPWTSTPGEAWGNVAKSLGFQPNQVQLVCGVMSHNAPLTWAHLGLFEGQHLVVMERFDALRALRAIDEHAVQFVMVVPTMMVRMLDVLKDAAVTLETLEAFYHTAALCPAWLKRAWIETLGPDRVYEMYGSGENVGQTIITGQEWLSHPGSVGRPFETDMRILGPNGEGLESGDVGELFMRRWSQRGKTRYLDPATTVRADPDGFVSVGDMAWIDGDGFVYLAGRRDDVINTGGVKVHPEKVEAALLSHPSVLDAVVVGVSDRDWGERVHAVIELLDRDRPIDLEDVKIHCSAQLSAYEVPKSMTIVDKLPRDGFGKVKRRVIREDFAASAT
ncbi:AMP-binding protein [Pararhizobium sp. LjRoot238]|uniref:AMP-binding protein n=1 Tax=Pararhizobium sp. LjRoot238 TaxID=3342293 RepID=UPI003ED052A1